MARTYTDYKAIIEFLLKEQKFKIDDALKAANVPVHYTDRIRQGFDPDFVKIKAPSLLIDETRQQVPLIQPFDEAHPQPYLSSYLNYLENVRGWNENVVENLRSASADIAARLPDPNTNENFQSRGLVVGHVQSGKTANMAALIARAADHGYRLIIVFAGIYNDLRAQTQDRMDQDITGKSEDIHESLLVSPDESAPRWFRYTQSGLRGDFRGGTTPFDPNPHTPKIAVLKKHPSVLENFRNWILDEKGDLGRFPVLLIDDEADLASINTKYAKEENGQPVDPSKTNLRIRELVAAFPKCTYVGFTATPFANVLIDADIAEDLYPRDFIAVLDEPEGYFGARQLFGLGMAPSALSPDEASDPEVNLIRFLTHTDLDILENVETLESGSPVLQTAVLSFILSSCARLARGQNNKHFSMLIHPSHEKAVHHLYRKVVEEEIDFLRQAAAHPAKFKSVTDQARSLWEKDFVVTSKDAGVSDKDIQNFDDIWRLAKSLIDEIEIVVLNSDSDDELNYKSDIPRRYIAIGGNRLSRGLTLEGLSVSLFLRNSDKYDTLLQMGRWFGYRHGYHDLTRIFVSEEMADAFAALARVEQELREDLRQYSQQENPPTPLEIKPKIRAHPTLSVTSALKMGAGKKINISLQHSRIETVTFPLDQTALLQENQVIVSSWMQKLGTPAPGSAPNDGYFWVDITPQKVIELLNAYNFGKDARKTNRQVLIDYILRQTANNELTAWDIIVPRGNAKASAFVWSPGISTYKVNRARLQSTSNKNHSIRVLSSPSDINSWRSKFGRSPEDSTRGGLFLYAIDRNSAGKDGKNRLFDEHQKDRSTDVIGLAFVFPQSRSNATVEYVTQEAY